jgi:hypothetical protein
VKRNNEGDSLDASDKGPFYIQPWFFWVMPGLFLATGIIFAVTTDQPVVTRLTYALLGFLGSVVSAAFVRLASEADKLLREVRATLKVSLEALRVPVTGEFLNATRSICDRVDGLETEFIRRVTNIDKNIPFSTDGLTPVGSATLLKRMRDLNDLAILPKGGSFPVKEYQMYWILVDFTEGLAPNLRIDAIASIAISEFDEIYGRAYLDTCARARNNNGVVTRRLFLIKDEHLKLGNRESTVQALRTNLEFLGGSNVKCIYFEEGQRFLEPGLEDFVVFGNDVIFAQRMVPQNGGTANRLLELVQEKSRVSAAVRIFNSLWENRKSMPATEFLDQISQKKEGDSP